MAGTYWPKTYLYWPSYYWPYLTYVYWPGAPAGTIVVANRPLFDKVLGEVLLHGHAMEVHANQHRNGGADPVVIDALAPPTDRTNLDASTSAHGLLPKGDGDATHFLSGNVTWAALGGSAIGKVATATAVDMKTAGRTVLYTVPTGKTFFPMFVLVRGLSASLAGGTDYDFGFGANADTWWQEINLTTMTTPATDYMQIGPCGTGIWDTCGVAGDEFGIMVNTGSTGAATATVDVFGFLA